MASFGGRRAEVRTRRAELRPLTAPKVSRRPAKDHRTPSSDVDRRLAEAKRQLEELLGAQKATRVIASIETTETDPSTTLASLRRILANADGIRASHREWNQ